MPLHTTNGWAVVDNDQINVRTVSPTRRAAIINWLVFEQGHRIYVSTPDDLIELAWEMAKGSATVHEVVIGYDPGEQKWPSPK